MKIETFRPESIEQACKALSNCVEMNLDLLVSTAYPVTGVEKAPGDFAESWGLLDAFSIFLPQGVRN